MKRFTVFLLTTLIFSLPATAVADPPEEKQESVRGATASATEETTPEDVEEMPPVVVTATKIETPTKEVGSSITVISAEEIENKQRTSVQEVLRGTPGLDVVQNGSFGATTSVFLRGANSEHTLVLIDGIEVNDPISTGRAFNFGNLTTENIERIEILRGPQSTLYGSDALGGVINIITKKGEGPPKVYASAEYGSHETFRETVGLSGGNDLTYYSLSVSRLDTDGISARDEDDGNREEDGHENTSISAKVGLTPTDNTDLALIARYTDASVDLDSFAGDDPNSVQDTEHFFIRGQATVTLFDGFWEQTGSVSYSDTERDSDDPPDPMNPLGSTSFFDGELLKFEWQHNLYLHETNTLTLGVETEEEEGLSRSSFGDFPKKDVRMNGYYVQDQIKLWNRFFTTVGVRLDDHESFGSETTFRVASAYIFEETGTKLKGSYGEGFKAPSLYQLFAPDDPFFGPVGNPNLEPEESEGWDIGIEQELFDGKVLLGATYFENDFDNLIIFVSGDGFVNVSQAESEGVELSAEIYPCENLSIRANYTYMETKDKSTGEELVRRPGNKAGIDVNYRFLEDRANMNLEVLYVGEREDTDFSTFPSTTVTLDDYTVVNLAASYDVCENLRIFGRVENIFDEDYEEVLGFGVPGFSAYAGVRVMF